MNLTLGIDYGKQHLGLALADGPLARPLVSLDLTPGEALPRLLDLIDREAVKLIVIGLPEGPMQDEIRGFGSSLTVKTGVPVVYHEESLSTQEAVSLLRAGGAKKSKLKQDHVYAACLILEDYLESST